MTEPRANSRRSTWAEMSEKIYNNNPNEKLGK